MIGFLLDANSVTCSHSGHPSGGVWKGSPANTDPEVSSTHESLAVHVTNVFKENVLPFPSRTGKWLATTDNFLSCHLTCGLMTHSTSKSMSLPARRDSPVPIMKKKGVAQRVSNAQQQLARPVMHCYTLTGEFITCPLFIYFLNRFSS